ncbi:MAG TPA: quinolinate synthase NadA [Candidatus Dormibacteraeota bacterium]|nr:quinolinate synthase NadA [Candidatus Dormibacteraeota bacterium]
MAIEALPTYSLSTEGIRVLSAEIRAMAKKRNAVILAHNYQVAEVQDVADYVGDSLGLSQQAAATGAAVIVFCGVHFMAETASILAPAKRVLIPDLNAGCSLSDSITADQLRAWKAEHPGAVVVSYVNCTAEVKAESDYCCTSGNAEKVIRAIPEDREILFLPDMFLGAHLERVTGRRLHVWMGECHVHAGIAPEDVDAAEAAHPGAELLIHPECGCTTSALYRYGDSGRLRVLSTEGIVKRARESAAEEFVVATENGILHRLHQEVPGKRFFPAAEHAICRYMKMITLTALHQALRDDVYEVKVPDDIAGRARLAVERMVAIT